jgi:hypothetical protein
MFLEKWAVVPILRLSKEAKLILVKREVLSLVKDAQLTGLQDSIIGER